MKTRKYVLALSLALIAAVPGARGDDPEFTPLYTEGNPLQPIDSGIKCEKCGSPMTVKKGPRGPFLGCSAYPKCRSTKPVPEELKEKIKAMFPAPAKKATPDVEIKETCPDCGEEMKLRPGRRGFFLGCSKYPKCKGTRELPPEVQEKIESATASSAT